MARSFRFQYYYDYRDYDFGCRNKYDNRTFGAYFGKNADDWNLKSVGKQRLERTKSVSVRRDVLDWRWTFLGKFDWDWIVAASEIRQIFSIESRYILCKRSACLLEFGLYFNFEWRHISALSVNAFDSFVYYFEDFPSEGDSV